jgi:hypothetical protein
LAIYFVYGVRHSLLNEEDSEEKATEDDEDSAAEEDESIQAESEDDSEVDQPEETNNEQMTYDEELAIKTYELLYGKPIKASGREVRFKDPEHVLHFAQMGIDYNKKMRDMRPHRSTLKTLEKEGLLGDEEKLNLLLEVKQGNKEALKRLLAENEIDPMDLVDDLEEGTSYKPQNHLISEQEVEIEEALNSIKQSPAYQQTIDVMTQELDQGSKEILSENPDYIVALNQDIETGVFNDVMGQVEYLRGLGQIPNNVSDIEAYIALVQQMNAEQQQGTQQVQTPVQNQQVAQPAQAKKKGASRRRKQGMANVKSSKKPNKPEYDPIDILSMDDSEFEKQLGGSIL